jgi:Tol biopolymer transport system component
MKTKDTYTLLTVLLVTAVVLALATPASATFPGKNGSIAFIMQPDVFTMNPDGTDVKQLTSLASNEATFGLAWSPDGSQLVFARALSDFSASQIWIMNADGSNQRQLLNDNSFFDDEPNFSPDGSQVVFQRCILPATSPCAVYRIQADGSGLTSLTYYSENTDELDLTPAYSPDAKKIAFFGAYRQGVLSAIYVMDADGSNVHQLTAPALEAFIPDYSPDGKRIVFSTRAFYPPNSINPQIWISNSNGPGLRQLTFPGTLAADVFVSWSPQGNAIVFERDNTTGAAIYVLNLDGTGTGEKLIFQTPITRKMQSMLPLDATGRNAEKKHRLSEIETGGSNPRWGPAPQ